MVGSDTARINTTARTKGYARQVCSRLGQDVRLVSHTVEETARKNLRRLTAHLAHNRTNDSDETYNKLIKEKR